MEVLIANAIDKECGMNSSGTKVHFEALRVYHIRLERRFGLNLFPATKTS